MTDPSITIGNGLILYFRVSELKKVWERAKKLNLDIEDEPHLNENSGQHQFTLRDLDGYHLIVSN